MIHLIKPKCIVVVILVLVALSYTDCVPIRRKRFILHSDGDINGMMITAKPNGPRTVLTGAALGASVHAQCPVKRSSDSQRVLLDDGLMRELYMELIGNMDKDMVAGDISEAEENFKHIHPAYRNTKKKNMQPSFGKIKSRLMKDIKTFNDWYDSITNSNTTSLSSAHESHPDLSDPLLEILEKSGITLEDLQRILKLTHDIEDIKHYRYGGNYRTKRSITEAEISRVEYCTKRGSPVGGDRGYLHMCSTCAMTTQLPSDVFPRYINELRCDQSDCDCFTVQGTSQGRCKQIVKNVRMLKRQTSGCRMLINNGTKLFMDDWVLYDQPVHVGCECVFDRRSVYETFIAKP